MGTSLRAAGRASQGRQRGGGGGGDRDPRQDFQGDTARAGQAVPSAGEPTDRLTSGGQTDQAIHIERQADIQTYRQAGRESERDLAAAPLRRRLAMC
jgi:hypothetical protein